MIREVVNIEKLETALWPSFHHEEIIVMLFCVSVVSEDKTIINVKLFFFCFLFIVELLSND